MLTKEQAMMICDEHDIPRVLDDPEERELLKANNPELLRAYLELRKLAEGPHDADHP